ncbi:MAG: ThuA domain-containing protein [Anaerolineae bacterium]
MSEPHLTQWKDEIAPYEPFPHPGKVVLAVVLGDHPVSVPAFHNMFRSFAEIDYYPMDLLDWVLDMAGVRSRYDAVLFYIFHIETPPGNEHNFFYQGLTASALEQLGQSSTGVVVMHHALNAFPEWDFWSRLTGLPAEERPFTLQELLTEHLFCERIPVSIADPDHRITQGLEPWDLTGETWNYGPHRLNPDCHTLLVTDHQAMRRKEIAWTHSLGQARVLCLQPGHNSDAFNDPHFRTVLSRGILWVAGRL